MEKALRLLEDDKWKWYHLFSSFFQEGGVSMHHLNSYNQFLDKILPEIVSDTNVVQYECKKKEAIHHVKFTNLKILRPTVTETNGYTHIVYPEECITRGLSYLCTVTVDVDCVC